MPKSKSTPAAARPARQRGRPKEYDPEVALACARKAFWESGFAGTSLDDLGSATGMNRPSLYGAFGDKRAIYLEALKVTCAEGEDAVGRCLSGKRPLREELREMYELLLSVFTSESNGRQYGCFIISTALAEAFSDERMRDACAKGLAAWDDMLTARFRMARLTGELACPGCEVQLARLAAGIVHTLAVRARAGESASSLKGIIDAAVKLLCGGAPCEGAAGATDGTPA